MLRGFFLKQQTLGSELNSARMLDAKQKILANIKFLETIEAILPLLEKLEQLIRGQPDFFKNLNSLKKELLLSKDASVSEELATTAVSFQMEIDRQKRIEELQKEFDSRTTEISEIIEEVDGIIKYDLQKKYLREIQRNIHIQQDLLSQTIKELKSLMICPDQSRTSLSPIPESDEEMHLESMRLTTTQP